MDQAAKLQGIIQQDDMNGYPKEEPLLNFNPALGGSRTLQGLTSHIALCLLHFIYPALPELNFNIFHCVSKKVYLCSPFYKHKRHSLTTIYNY